MPDPIADLGITCPPSSKFYVCDNQVSRFLGCCTFDPCSVADGQCAYTDIEAIAYDPYKGSAVPKQSCAPGNDGSPAMWYTCPDSNPSFMGCCTVDACSSMGCPAESVTAARLSDRMDDAAVFLPDSMSTSATSTATAVSISMTTAISAAAATAAASTSESGSTSPTTMLNSSASSQGEMSTSATIAVAVTATMIGLGIIGLLFYWVFKRMRIASQNDDVPDFPHEKPNFDAPPADDDPAASSSSSIIELQNLYAELEHQKVRIHEAHLQAQAQEEAQAQAQEQAQKQAQEAGMGIAVTEMPGRAVVTGDYQQQH